MTALFNLAYISKSMIEGTDSEIAEAVTKILDSSKRNNTLRGVTGALLFSGGYFCQVIEGEQSKIEELFEIIQMDDRHGDITVLHFEPLDRRNFENWAMAFAGAETSMRLAIPEVRGSNSKIEMAIQGRALISTLEKLVHTHQQLEHRIRRT